MHSSICTCYPCMYVHSYIMHTKGVMLYVKSCSLHWWCFSDRPGWWRCYYSTLPAVSRVYLSQKLNLSPRIPCASLTWGSTCEGLYRHSRASPMGTETSTTWWAWNNHKGVQIRPNHKSPSQKSKKNTLKDYLGNYFLFILLHHNSLI